jgi:hypothetical protein
MMQHRGKKEEKHKRKEITIREIFREIDSFDT